MRAESSGIDDIRKAEDSVLLPFVVISLTLHIVVVLVVPLLAHLFSPRVIFERPQSFQLVSPPRIATPSVPAVQKPSEPAKPAPPKAAEKPAPKKSTDKPKKKIEETTKQDPPPPQEDLDELSSLLNEIPPPAQVSAVGKFRFNAYLMYVQSKIESKWQPPSQKKDVTVTVSFTIFQDGSISDVTVSESAGSAVVDNMAITAVKVAAPFSNLPPTFSGDRQEFSVKLNTALR
jgi:TonB family protein